jgi:hypothetical protein
MGAWFPHGELNPDLSLERAASLPLDYVGMHGVGFEPTRFTTPGLKSGSLDHSDNRAYSLNSLEFYSDLSTTTNVVHIQLYTNNIQTYKYNIYKQICRVGFEPTILSGVGRTP